MQSPPPRTVVPNVENPPKNKFTQGAFTRFSMQVSENFHIFRFRLPVIHIQNLSNRCRHKYDPSISRVFQSNFWQVFDVWCAPPLPPAPHSGPLGTGRASGSSSYTALQLRAKGRVAYAYTVQTGGEGGRIKNLSTAHCT